MSLGTPSDLFAIVDERHFADEGAFEEREPVLSVVVMHHPGRGDVSDLVRACLPLVAKVVEDPEPDGPPSPLRTARRAWAAVAPGATHHLVLQDDVTPVTGFAELVRRAVRARSRHAVALYSNWNSPRNAYLVRSAAVAGQAWAPLGYDEWVPTLGLVLPADAALRLGAYLATLPDDARDDDEAVVTFCKRAGHPIVATVPHLVEHGTGPSFAGNDAHGARHATIPADDSQDPRAWDAPEPDSAPPRRSELPAPATARSVAVVLDRSRCSLRVLRPLAGEPLEHPFGWGWDTWADWLGADPADVAREVRDLVARRSPWLADVPGAALVELAAACWLLGYDVARTAWPPPNALASPTHRESAVRTGVLSGLRAADRPVDFVDELVAFGLTALVAGESSALAPRAPHQGLSGTGLAHELESETLSAARLLAAHDAEILCRAAGAALPTCVVVHDCPTCGAGSAAAVPDVAAHLAHGVAAVVSGVSDGVAAHWASPDVATVEILACERPEVRCGRRPRGRPRRHVLVQRSARHRTRQEPSSSTHSGAAVRAGGRCG